VYENSEFQLVLPFQGHTEERLLRLISQTGPDEANECDRVDLAQRIVDLITAMLDGEVLAPTDRQLKYAATIAQEFSLELPAQVLHYRSAMAAFLGVYAPLYRRRKSDAKAPGTPQP
jgi:hypothetical protein